MAITINQEKLRFLIEAYKADFSKNIENEIYKWKAIAHFQKHWNINAANFTEMLKLALGFENDNLLSGAMYFPKRMIWRFSELEEDVVKDMFVKLFDESDLNLAERINVFSETSNEILHRHWTPDKNHYQDYRAISTYLWLMFPDKYYIYKADCVAALAKYLDLDFKRSYKLKGQNVVNVYSIYDQVAECLQQDKELCAMLDEKMDEECYRDTFARTLSMDFGYYLKTYYKQTGDSEVSVGNKIWLYAPGENARFWDECVANGKMYLGWDPLGDLSKYASREDMAEKMKEVYGADKSYTNDSLSTYDFVYTIKPGDIVYVKKGMHKIIGRGVVTGGFEYDAERKEYNNTRNVEWQNNGDWNVESQLVMKTLTDITKYPDFVASLQSLIDGANIEVKDEPTDAPSGFWWLNANPKYWSMSEWTVGAEQYYTLLNENGRKRRIYQNFVNAKVGDAVICYESNPTKQILCLATVLKASDGERIYFKKVETLANGIDYATFKDVPELQQMECLVNPNGSFFKLTAEEYDVLMDIIRESNPLAPAKTAKLYTKENFLEDVYISSADYDALCGVLEHKKNIIFQGAPGVGKTFSAKRLAYSIMGEVDDDRIGFVQFHQNYSYEDFVMGYKPNSEGGFDLQRGIFYKFCIKAANDPGRKYFFIIDEINRGNLSKIFGELLMLIEKDYRANKITLAYSDERFAVPANLYIIGMMNTADRSLAMIDYALRRRFSFYPMKPGFDSDGFKQYQEELGNEKFNALIEKVKELNKAIVDDGSLGSGFEIGHSYFCNQEEIANSWLQAVVNYEIIPMLEEYWFDNKDNVDEWSEKLKKVIND